jgi:hypothetical protein
MRDAGLGAHKGPCGIAELEKFQDVLAPEYQIKVYGTDEMQMLIYKGTYTL